MQPDRHAPYRRTLQNPCLGAGCWPWTVASVHLREGGDAIIRVINHLAEPTALH